MDDQFKDSTTNWSSGLAWLLAIANLIIAWSLLDGLSDPRPVSVQNNVHTMFRQGAFVLVCLPLFGTGLVLSIVGICRRESFGVASILLTLITFGAVVYFQIIDPVFLDTPERRARREQRDRQDRREEAVQQRARSVRRANGDIMFTEQSFVVRLVNSRWWMPGCAGGLAIGLTFWFMRRRAPGQSSVCARDGAEQNVSAQPIQARCPKCAADVTTLLARGGSSCPACHLELVMSRGASDEAPGRTSLMHDLLCEGSSIYGISALLGVIALTGLAITWLGLLLAGQWIASKNIAWIFLIGLCALGTLVALRARRS